MFNGCNWYDTSILLACSTQQHSVGHAFALSSAVVHCGESVSMSEEHIFTDIIVPTVSLFGTAALSSGENILQCALLHE